jgi:ribosomal protein S18 acetylase RimI-like enzyme
MNILKNNTRKINQGIAIKDIDTTEVAKSLAVAYQSIFAGRIWNEAGKDKSGQAIGIDEIRENGGIIDEAYFPISKISDQFLLELQSAFTSESEMVLLVTEESSNINDDFQQFTVPAGEFPSNTGPFYLNDELNYVAGFCWAKKVSTLDVLQSKGDFTSLQSEDIIGQFDLDSQIYYLSELGVIDALRNQGMGRVLVSSLLESLSGMVTLNTSLNSPAFKLFSSFGFEVLNGPNLFDRDGYVFMLKNN